MKDSTETRYWTYMKNDINVVRLKCRTTIVSQEAFDELVEIWKTDYPGCDLSIAVVDGSVQCRFVEGY